MSATTASDATNTAHPPCPFCRSDRVGTTSKSIGEETYWRCRACGQIWNPSRLRALPPMRTWRP